MPDHGHPRRPTEKTPESKGHLMSDWSRYLHERKPAIMPNIHLDPEEISRALQKAFEPVAEAITHLNNAMQRVHDQNHSAKLLFRVRSQEELVEKMSRYELVEKALNQITKERGYVLRSLELETSYDRQTANEIREYLSGLNFCYALLTIAMKGELP